MRTITTILSLLLFTTVILAHRTLIMVDDNGDGTIYIETGLSSGGSAAGATLLLTETTSGRPLWKGTVPEAGYITVDRPSVPYSVTVDMGTGHTVTQEGPELKEIAPPTEVIDTPDSSSSNLEKPEE